MVRIGIDARLIHLPGVGRYVRCLLRGLDRLHDDQIEIIAYFPPGISADFRNIRVREVTTRPYSVFEQLAWPFLVQNDGLACLHAPHYVVPAFPMCSLVVTLHDAVYYRYKPHSRLFSAYYRLMHRIAAVRSKRIIAVSEYSRKELMKFLRVNQQKIAVIPNAVDPVFKRLPDDVVRVAKRRYGLPDSFVLYVGTNKPWKNLRTLLKAFRKIGKREPECVLVIAGKRGRYEENRRQMIADCQVEKNVLLLDEVRDADLAVLYNAARAVVCPSLYEGFGLVPLEAMACGTPVIASRAASLPEVLNGAAVMVNGSNEDEWAEAIIRVWEDGDLREHLASVSLKWSANFTIERMAKETLDLYKVIV